ncbi:hypothetical protein m4_igs_168 [Acanthamoeba polyphaga mimivirus]|nr:hypothetical protein m4_igs_168 [Acanthamoeba polyphaga mimivirus]
MINHSQKISNSKKYRISKNIGFQKKLDSKKN